MSSELLIDRRISYSERAFAELVVWKVDPPVRASAHAFKYRLAFVVNGVCVIRYDNEAGKGDHKHVGSEEIGITFRDVTSLIEAFEEEVEAWLGKE